MKKLGAVVVVLALWSAVPMSQVLRFKRMVVTPPPSGDFDTSDYRTTTYGAPDHYCDPTRSLGSSGAGTVGDAWNMTQCAASPVAGDVIGILPIGAGTPVDIATTNNDNIPAFNPANSGSSDGNRIVFVAKYAAIGLANVESNTNRSEWRTSASAPGISGGVGTGNGCAVLGASSRNYITYDGFYVNQAEAWMKEDSGSLRAELSTGITFTNFVIKGTAHTIASNPVVYRPQQATNTILKNFRVYDFSNDPTGSDTPQQGLFSDQYGDQNYLIEFGDISNTERGPFPKGTASGIFNYGTMRYNIVRDLDSCFRFNDFDPTNQTEIHHNLCYNWNGNGSSAYGAALSSETSPPRRLFFHHNTIADGNCDDINCNGPFYIKDDSSAANVTVSDNIFDWLNGGNGHGVDAGEFTATFPTFNYNGYYKAGAAITWAYNGAESGSIAAWRTATGQEANSVVLSTSPFNNRAGNDFTIAAGHAALTASLTGGELGAYEGTINPGPFGSY